MRPAMVWLLLGKEMLEVVRDRRTLFLMIGLPLLMYPVLFLVTSQAAVQRVQDVQDELVTVAVEGAPIVPPQLGELIEEDDRLALVVAEEGAEYAVRLRLEEGFDHALASDGSGAVTIIYDATDEVGARAEVQLQRILKRWDRALVSGRLSARSLPGTLATPLAITSDNVAPPQKVGRHLLAQVVPMVLVLMLIMGAFYPAIEVTAGEKERGTLQTLLTAPISAIEIITGKFLAVFVVTGISAASNILSLGLLVVMMGSMAASAGPNAPQLELGLTAGSLGLVALVSVMIGLMFSAIMMTIAVLARNFKEAQAYVTPVYILSLLPVMFGQVSGIELTDTMALVPGLNQVLLLKGILEGSYTANHVFLVGVSTVIYTLGTLTIAARIFERESILLGEVGIRGLFGGPPPAPSLIPRASEAFALCAVVFILLFYVGSVAQAWHLIAGLAITQWLVIGGPIVGFVLWRRLNFKATLGLTMPSASSIGAATLLGATVWYPLLQLAAYVQRQSPELSAEHQALEEMLQKLLGAETPLLVLLMVVAVSPAICEEALFRGVLLRSMVGRFRTRTIIVVTALLFGAFHMSAARFLPTAGLGLIMAVMALASGSLLPGVIFHLLHNGLNVLSARLSWSLPGITSPGPPDPMQATVFGAGLLLGILLLTRSVKGR